MLRRLLALRLVAIALGAGLLAGAAHAQPQTDLSRMSADELVAQAETLHPVGLYMLAAKLFSSGARDDAVRWFYIGQIRYRFHLAANPQLPRSGDPALFASLTESVGRPVNEYAGGNVDDWLAAIDHALEWDERHRNGFTSKTQHAAQLRTVRGGLVRLRASLAADRENIRRQR